MTTIEIGTMDGCVFLRWPLLGLVLHVEPVGAVWLVEGRPIYAWVGEC